MRRSLLATSLLALASCGSPSGPEPGEGWDVFLLVGQSNMAGMGPLAGYAAPDLGGRAWVLRGGAWKPAAEPLGEGSGVGPGVAFAQRLLELDPGRTVGLVPCARGGSTLRQWQPRDPSALYRSCVAMARAAQPRGRIAGILVLQGESEGLGEGRPEEWGRLFRNLAVSFRFDLRRFDVPVIVGQIGDVPRGREASAAAWATVQREQEEAAASLPNAALVRTAGLPTQDGIHFTTPAYREVGRRFADAYRGLARSR